MNWRGQGLGPIPEVLKYIEQMYEQVYRGEKGMIGRAIAENKST